MTELASPMGISTISYDSPQIIGDEVDWKGRIVAPGTPEASVTFRFTCPDPKAFEPRLRPFLLAFLPAAMKIGLPVVLEEPLDRVTWENLMEWQAGMARWFPERLKVVPIRCPLKPLASQHAGPEREALTAFSGGVDSCFTALRHSIAPDTGTYRRTRLGAGLMVHGFDIPVDQTEVFASAFQGSQRILHSLGLQAYRVRTDLRQLEKVFGCSWEQETHGIWLAATLAIFEPFFGPLLIPSTYPYEKLKFPWASNPVSDPLCGSEASSVWHDGAAFHKLAKVQAVASHAGIERDVRVCWQGSRLDRNCGHCFKCVATQVCYWLAQVPEPEGFPSPCTLQEVRRTPLKNDQNRYLFQSLHAEAARQGNADLTRALASTLGRNTRRRVRRTVKQLCLNPRAFLTQL